MSIRHFGMIKNVYFVNCFKGNIFTYIALYIFVNVQKSPFFNEVRAIGALNFKHWNHISIFFSGF